MLEDVFLKQMRKMLIERFAQLQQKVNVVMATGRIPDDLTVMGPDYKRFLEVYLGEALVQGMISATDVVRRLKRREGFAVTPDPVIPTDAITWMQARVALLGKWPRDLDSQVISVISQGLQQGSSRQVIMAELQAQIFSSYSQARLENIARTETTAAYNHGLLAGFAQPDSGVVAVQYVSILDARTTDICRARNGLVLPVDSPKLVENTPPLHYQCRSVLSPITEYAMEKLKAGDARYQQRHFGYLDDEFALNPPKTLDEAMAGWEKAPAPQAGFGTLGERAPKTPSGPTPQKAESEPVTKGERRNAPPETGPNPNPKRQASPASPPSDRAEGLRERVEAAKAGGAETVDGVKSIGSVAREEIEARTALLNAKIARLDEERKALRKQYLQATRAGKPSTSIETAFIEKGRELRELRDTSYGDTALDVLREVLDLGNPGQQSWTTGSSSEAIEFLNKAASRIPSQWWEKSNPQPILAILSNDCHYDDGVIAVKNEESSVHELGHHFQELIPKLIRLTDEFWVHRKGVFPDPYMGKRYGFGDPERLYRKSEVLSMGLQGLFFDDWMWQDKECVDFILGLLIGV